MWQVKKIKGNYLIMNTNDVICSNNNFDSDVIEEIFKYNSLIDDLKLIQLASEARKLAYCPYSKFSVGAALLAEGDIFIAGNIETASHTADVCAERAAFIKAIAGGYKKFKKIAIMGGKCEEKSSNILPCGICLQFMTDFVDDSFEIITLTNDNIEKYKLTDLLNKPFKRFHI